MSNEISTFHHLGISTRDMAAAVRQYERLGFMFTPMSIPKIPLKPGGPPEALGVANRCAIFQNNYLEMLGVIDATRWASITSEQRGPFDIDKLLQRYQGLHVMHFSTDDLDAVRSRLEKDCLHPSEIRPFQRPVDTPDGTKMCAPEVCHSRPTQTRKRWYRSPSTKPASLYYSHDLWGIQMALFRSRSQLCVLRTWIASRQNTAPILPIRCAKLVI